MLSYDNKHWEQLIDTILDRLGTERFLEMASYVLEQRGHVQLAGEITRLAPKGRWVAVAREEDPDFDEPF